MNISTSNSNGSNSNGSSEMVVACSTRTNIARSGFRCLCHASFVFQLLVEHPESAQVFTCIVDITESKRERERERGRERASTSYVSFTPRTHTNN